MNTQKLLEFDYDQPTKASSGQMVCLGMTFENDEERRKYFTEKLHEKLQDLEFRMIKGFPIGFSSTPHIKLSCPARRRRAAFPRRIKRRLCCN